MKSPISTHVLDTSRGMPAAGITVILESQSSGGQWKEIARGETDSDGRLSGLLKPDAQIPAGMYRLTFHTEQYFRSRGTEGLYPSVPVVFTVRDSSAHYHIPLLLSPFGYSTYRGS